jgi:hypothetical protein
MSRCRGPADLYACVSVPWYCCPWWVQWATFCLGGVLYFCVFVRDSFVGRLLATPGKCHTPVQTAILWFALIVVTLIFYHVLTTEQTNLETEDFWKLKTFL